MFVANMIKHLADKFVDGHVSKIPLLWCMDPCAEQSCKMNDHVTDSKLDQVTANPGAHLV